MGYVRTRTRVCVYTNTSIKGAGYTVDYTETVVFWSHPNCYYGIAILWLLCVDCGGNENILQRKFLRAQDLQTSYGARNQGACIMCAYYYDVLHIM